MRLTLGRHPGVTVVAVVVVGLLAWGFWPRPVPVETAPVRRAPLTVTVEEDGRTRVIDRYRISAPVDGVACRLDLDVGDAVRKDQVLLGITPLAPQVLDPRSRAQAEARLAAAEAALAAAGQQADVSRAEAVYFRAEHARLAPLAERGVIAQEELDRAEMQVARGEAALRAAEHAMEVARYQLEAARAALTHSAAASAGAPAERVLLRSPSAGRVLAVAHACEGPVRTGEVLLEVGDPGLLEVVVDLLSADAVKVAPGTRVWFDRWGGDGLLEGVVRTVEPVGVTRVSALGVEEQRVLVVADFISPPAAWQRLGDGYRVEARFVLWHGDAVLQVPSGSLFRRGADWAVFVVADGRASLRPVEIGQRTGLAAQVLDGLGVDEVVVVHPGDAVADGVRVVTRE